jgi:PncC family amidohydrolase
MRKRDKQINFLSEKVGKSLSEKKLRLAVAESCTGGLLSSCITDISRSSEYFILGIVAYSRVQKERLLKIPKAILEKHSPVSGKVSSLMAQNAKRIAKTDIGIGITGYAGPTGGTVKNPVGTVYIALVFRGKILTKRYLFKWPRVAVKRKAVEKALVLLYEVLSNS